jgi:hypothetical protein
MSANTPAIRAERLNRLKKLNIEMPPILFFKSFPFVEARDRAEAQKNLRSCLAHQQCGFRIEGLARCYDEPGSAASLPVETVLTAHHSRRKRNFVEFGTATPLHIYFTTKSRFVKPSNRCKAGFFRRVREVPSV